MRVVTWSAHCTITVHVLETFYDFDFNISRLEVFFMRFLKDDNPYKSLTKIIKIIMMLSGGQSEGERGFSIDENALDDNIQMKTIVAQRKVNDYIRKSNFQPHNMPLSRVSLQSAKQAHFM